MRIAMDRRIRAIFFFLIILLLTAGCSPIPKDYAQWDTDKQSVYMGLQALQKKDYKKARFYFAKGLRANPQNCQLNFFNGLSYQLEASGSNRHLLALAKIGYNQSIKFCPYDPWPKYYSGLIALQEGNYALAEKFFSAATRTSSKRQQTEKFLMAYFYAAYEAGDKTAMMRTIALIKKLDPDSPLVKNLEKKVDNLRTPQHSKKEARSEKLVLNKAVEEKKIKLTKHKKQAIIDGTIILSREIAENSRGVNLLSALKLQYGNGTSPGLAYTATSSGTSQWKQLQGAATAAGMSALSGPSIPYTTQLINQISIPAITYDLDIFNDNDEQDEILARPSLIVEDGKTSDYFSGRELILGIQGTQVGTVTKLRFGVDLNVTPHFEKNGNINLDVKIGRDFLIPVQAVTSFDQTAEALSEQTQVSLALRYGETAILSALNEKIEDQTSNRVPILGRIPLVKTFFNRNEREQTHTSLLILLTLERFSGFKSNEESEASQQALYEYHENMVHPENNIKSIVEHLMVLDVNKMEVPLVPSLYSKATVKKAVNAEFDSISGDKLDY